MQAVADGVLEVVVDVVVARDEGEVVASLLNDGVVDDDASVDDDKKACAAVDNVDII